MSNTNQAVQPQKMAEGLKFRIWEEEVLYYIRSENKEADYLAAGLRFVFTYAKYRFSHNAAHIETMRIVPSRQQPTKIPISRQMA